MAKGIEKILHGCFHPKDGRPNLHKVPVNMERARQHIDKARRNLRAMKIMFDNDLFDWTIICGYYAMYHAVLAALFEIGLRATAHYCAIAAFKMIIGDVSQNDNWGRFSRCQISDAEYIILLKDRINSIA